MKKEIIEYAKSLKIDDIGFTDFEIANWYSPRVSKFYAKKLNCNISLDKEKLLKQNELLPNMKTVITLVMVYPYDEKLANNTGVTSTFSSSSWGIDYHKVLKEKLEKIQAYIKEEYNINSHIQVDNGDFDDRYWAYKSGLGMYGKNGMFIHNEFGSFVFLGEIFIDKHIAPNNFIEKTCYGCNACIRMCPTNAIKNGNMTIEATKCLSYLSQTKEKLQEDLAEKLTNIYGCDICQQICPHNDKVYQHNTEWQKTDLEEVNLLEFIKQTNKEFKEKYGHLAGAWRGKLVLIRNAIWILTNRENIEIIPVIEELLNNNYPEWFKQNLLKCKEILEKKSYERCKIKQNIANT